MYRLLQISLLQKGRLKTNFLHIHFLLFKQKSLFKQLGKRNQNLKLKFFYYSNQLTFGIKKYQELNFFRICLHILYVLENIALLLCPTEGFWSSMPLQLTGGKCRKEQECVYV
jgi:hypothetical protein